MREFPRPSVDAGLHIDGCAVRLQPLAMAPKLRRIKLSRAARHPTGPAPLRRNVRGQALGMTLASLCALKTTATSGWATSLSGHRGFALSRLVA